MFRFVFVSVSISVSVFTLLSLRLTDAAVAMGKAEAHPGKSIHFLVSSFIIKSLLITILTPVFCLLI